MDEDSLNSLYQQISTTELNKGGKHPSTLLSSSYKIKVKDLDDLKTAGITDPIDIILGNYDEDKVKLFSEGITNWKRIVELSVDELVFPENVIKSFKKNKFNLIKHLIIAPNSQLKDLGATYSQINAFRSKLIRKKGTDLKAPKTVSKKTKSVAKKGKKTKPVAKKGKKTKPVAKKGKKTNLGIKKFEKTSTAKPKKPTSKKKSGSKPRSSKGSRSKKSK
jgi:hypothetical protein